MMATAGASILSRLARRLAYVFYTLIHFVKRKNQLPSLRLHPFSHLRSLDDPDTWSNTFIIIG